MKIFPAIDMIGGSAVRLLQGDYDKKTVYSDSPADVAEKFAEAGAGYLHLVDLDGAREGSPANFETVREICRRVDMYVEIGGGIRDEERIVSYLEAGVDRVILGTIAVKDRAFLEAMTKRYGDKIAVGVDARDGLVAVSGWEETTAVDAFAFCQYLAGIGVQQVIYTDISRDGAMQGTNMEAYRRLSALEGLAVTASGGICSLEEIRALRGVVDAAILGKALYTGALDLTECISVAEGGTL